MAGGLYFGGMCLRLGGTPEALTSGTGPSDRRCRRGHLLRRVLEHLSGLSAGKPRLRTARDVTPSPYGRGRRRTLRAHRRVEAFLHRFDEHNRPLAHLTEARDRLAISGRLLRLVVFQSRSEGHQRGSPQSNEDRETFARPWIRISLPITPGPSVSRAAHDPAGPFKTVQCQPVGSIMVPLHSDCKGIA